VSSARVFGLSTHLYHGQRLGRHHLLEIAAHGFRAVELVATSTHIDYRNVAAIADLQAWLADAALDLHSVHGPTAEGFTNGRWDRPLSLASGDVAQRERAVFETEQALYIARRIPYQVLVLHLGLPRTRLAPLDEHTRDAARRSVEHLAKLAAPLGVRLAVEVILNPLSKPGSLVHFVEHVLDGSRVGICLDVGHAHLDGGLLDAIDVVSEHVVATHLHDNRGRHDDHLVPFEGDIDWASALTAIQKIGYDGAFLFEIAAKGAVRGMLAQARNAREKMERLLSETQVATSSTFGF
jgi:sugar phosphate isomerase/epimerase